jgi:hypothetical protein
MMKHCSKLPKIEAKNLGLRCKERKTKNFFNENKRIQAAR